MRTKTVKVAVAAIKVKLIPRRGFPGMMDNQQADAVLVRKLFEAPDKELIKSTALHDACALVEFIDSLENIDGLFASPQ